MASKGQITGMRGVYLVAAELVRRNFIVSPTSRSAMGADLLITDQKCKKAFSIQVKTNASTFSFWLLDKKAKKIKSDSHIYAFVNLKEKETEYFIIPSKIVAKEMRVDRSKRGTSTWYSIYYEKALPYKNKWSLLGKP